LEIMGPRERKILCGVLLGRLLGVPQEKISGIRSGIHKLRSGGVSEPDLDHYVRSLKGRIAQVRSIAPKKASKLSVHLETALNRD
jgi:hypothetical protein